MFIECEAVRICSLEHAMDDNMGPLILIFDTGRHALFQRVAEGRWEDVSTKKVYSKTRDGVFEVA